MTKNRLEAFSDGVIAIIITIMVLELKRPHGVDFAALGELAPVLLGYVLSFVYVAIYWNNHHHLLHAAERVTGGVLWANLHLLFWLSLIPFATDWMGEARFPSAPVALYGGVLLMCAIAYWILVRVLIRAHGRASALGRAIGRDAKGIASIALYVAGIALSAWWPWLGCGIYAAVALMWLVPDRRIEGHVADRPHAG